MRLGAASILEVAAIGGLLVGSVVAAGTAVLVPLRGTRGPSLQPLAISVSALWFAELGLWSCIASLRSWDGAAGVVFGAGLASVLCPSWVLPTVAWRRVRASRDAGERRALLEPADSPLGAAIWKAPLRRMAERSLELAVLRAEGKRDRLYRSLWGCLRRGSTSLPWTAPPGEWDRVLLAASQRLVPPHRLVQTSPVGERELAAQWLEGPDAKTLAAARVRVALVRVDAESLALQLSIRNDHRGLYSNVAGSNLGSVLGAFGCFAGGGLATLIHPMACAPFLLLGCLSPWRDFSSTSALATTLEGLRAARSVACVRDTLAECSSR